MFRLVLAGMLLLMSGHWFFTVFQMSQNVDNFEMFHELAGQATTIGWMMGVLIFVLIINHTIGERND